jgi:hypothetical protein
MFKKFSCISLKGEHYSDLNYIEKVTYNTIFYPQS